MSEGNPISGMTKEEEEEYREAFGMFDINGDGCNSKGTSSGNTAQDSSIKGLYMSFVCGGTIELTELKQVMLQLGQNPAEEDLIEMMRLVDVNGDNEIDFEEFLVMMTMRSGERDTEAELREAFKLFDLDGSGTISREELSTLMKNLGQALTDEEIDAMIDEVDENLDGEISFEEFQALMLS